MQKYHSLRVEVESSNWLLLNRRECGSVLDLHGEIPLVPYPTEIVPKPSFVVQCSGFDHEDLIGKSLFEKKPKGVVIKQIKKDGKL